MQLRLPPRRILIWNVCDNLSKQLYSLSRISAERPLRWLTNDTTFRFLTCLGESPALNRQALSDARNDERLPVMRAAKWRALKRWANGGRYDGPCLSDEVAGRSIPRR